MFNFNFCFGVLRIDVSSHVNGKSFGHESRAPIFFSQANLPVAVTHNGNDTTQLLLV